MRVDHYGCYPITQTKLVNFKILLNALVNWSTLHYFAKPAITKCKPVAVLQLSLTLMTGRTRTNSH